MRKSNFTEPKQVLVFNGAQVLIAVIRSVHSASELTGIHLQAVSYACNGKYNQTGGFYFRTVHPNVEIDINDLDDLKLQDYDEMCNDKSRKYMTIREMAKKRKRLINKRKQNKEEGNGQFNEKD